MTINTEHYWMPFTANRQFKARPRMMQKAAGMHYTTDDGRQILDGTAGLWCVNAGHGHPAITRAVVEQAATMDFAPPFQMGHAGAFKAASALAAMAPADLNRVFFCNSGSEAVDTALKMALAFHRIRGDGLRTRLIGRERGYHGVGFGGIAVGGIAGNRKHFGPSLPGVDHLRHPLDIARNAFSRGLPEHGAELADEFEQRLLALHDPATVAALIVEPVQGSTGVIIPPKGYLQKLRAICDKHGILLIFDEVITGFGRLGTAFAADYFGVIPDMICCAKGLTNAAVPMGAVIVKQSIHDAFMAAAPENGIEFYHGYTYSGHPVACAVALANLDIIEGENLVGRVRDDTGPYLAAQFATLLDHPLVGEAESCGLMAGLVLVKNKANKAPFPAELEVGMRCRTHCFANGLIMRAVGDRMIIAPPLTITHAQIDELTGLIRKVLDLTLADAQASGWMD